MPNFQFPPGACISPHIPAEPPNAAAGLSCPPAAAFTLGLASELCRLSRDSYDEHPNGQIIDQWPDTRALIVPLPNSATAVIFRGTRNLEDLITDLECRLVPEQDFHIHAGFAAAVRTIQEDLVHALSKLAPAQTLWFTGHSLGGALAMRAAFHFAARVAGVITFGQPRVGDAAFARRYDEVLGDRTWRVVHSDDIVPRVPWLLGRYRHAGHEVFFPPPSRIHGRIPGGEIDHVIDPSVLRKFPWDIRGLARAACRGKFALLDDHHIDNYMRLLTAARHSEAKQAIEEWRGA